MTIVIADRNSHGFPHAPDRGGRANPPDPCRLTRMCEMKQDIVPTVSRLRRLSRRSRRLAMLVSVDLLVRAAILHAAGSPDERAAFFETRIRPILAANGYKCHGD